MPPWVDRNALTLESGTRLWIEEQVLAFRSMCGRSVARWVGHEMALWEVGPSGTPVFHDPAIPYLQVCPLYLEFVERGGRDIHTYPNDWTHSWGLCVDVLYGSPPDESSEVGSIFRTRTLGELPVGVIEDVRIVQVDRGDIAEVYLRVNGACVALWSGEIYEEANRSLRVVRPDECVLVAIASEQPQPPSRESETFYY
jgi:hypothetical protein